MMRNTHSVILAGLLLSLAGPAMVAAADGASVNGAIEFGFRGLDGEDSAEFQKFRTMDDGVFGDLQLDVNMSDYHLRMEAMNEGSKEDWSFVLKGGKYGLFKYKFDLSEMPHNYYFDARTPASGLGSDHLVFPLNADVPPLANWNPFDYKVDHQSYGGELELSFNTSYHLNVAVERRLQDGFRPYSTKQFAEVPEPISTTTDNFSGRFGYEGGDISASVSGSLSKFENDLDHMLWDDPDDATYTELVVFAQDSRFWKVASDVSWRNLPLNSVLAASGSFYRLENDYTANDIGFDITNGRMISAGDLPFNRYDFKGDVKSGTASLALRSRPMAKLNTKLYYRYIRKDNDSSIITYDAGDKSNAHEFLSYEKHVAGINVAYSLPAKNKLEAGYEFLDIDRSTPAGDGIPADETRDHSAFVQLKNRTFDWMTAKLRYTHLERDSSVLGREIDSTTPTTFYYQDQRSDQVKSRFEFYPMEQLDLGVVLAYKQIEYDGAIDTRQDEKRSRLYLDAAWRACDAVSLRGSVGFENVRIEANRITNNDPAPIYGQETKEDFWSYGIGANYQVTSRLNLDAAWQFQRSDGSVDFDNDFTGTSYVNIKRSDDYKKNQVEAKAVYALTENLSMTLSYLYAEYDFWDYNYANYPSTYIFDGDNYLSGLYSDRDYTVHAGFLAVSYQF